MLVSKKQNWEVYQEPTATPAKRTANRVNHKVNRAIKSQCLVLISIIALMAMLVTMQSASIVNAGYELVQIKAQMAALEKNNDQLKLDIAKLKSPQRIQAIATQDLGMIIPKSVYYASASVLPSGKTGPDEQATANHTTSIFTRKAEAGGRR